MYVQAYEEYLDQPFLAYFRDISLIKKHRRLRSRFDIMESIIANITFPFALLLSFPPIVCLAIPFEDPIRFVKNGCDMDGVIASLHGQAFFAGLLASLPWSADPIIKHQLAPQELFTTSQR